MQEYGEVKVNVDTVLFTLKDDRLHIALAPRSAEFKKDEMALVGAMMDGNRHKSLEDVVRQSLKDKAGLDKVYFEQLQTFSGTTSPDGRPRDIRWPSITVAYIALVPVEALQSKSAIERGLTLLPLADVGELPFDHNRIVSVAISRLRGKGAWSTLPGHLLKPNFTMSELNDVYNKVLGQKIDKANFRRKVLEHGMVVSVGQKVWREGYRPVEHFKLNDKVSTIDIRL